VDDLYLTYRPKDLDAVVGQDHAVAAVRGLLQGRPPHAVLFSGPSGTGKTTLARIFARELGCSDIDFHEVNCAVVEAMETARGIRDRLNTLPMGGKRKVYYLDEIQSFSRAGFSQQALLKMLEDTPRHAYFLLATTEPLKVIRTVRGRCHIIHLQPLPPTTLASLAQDVAKKEGHKLTAAVATALGEQAAGSAREALVLLRGVLGLPEKEQLARLRRGEDDTRPGFDLVKALLPWKGAPRWADVASVLKDLEAQNPEQLRQLVLACARTTLLKGGANAPRAAFAISVFRDPSYDEHMAGHAALASCC
jgi:replication-associated recombination protein RarA